MNPVTKLPAKPRPRLDGPERPFWEGLREGQVRVQKCLSCDSLRFPASRYCAKCHSDASEWAAVPPSGVVESFCVFHRAYFPGFVNEMPYAVVQVKLDSGVRFFSNMPGMANEDIRIGMGVKAFFDRADRELTLLKFKPEN